MLKINRKTRGVGNVDDFVAGRIFTASTIFRVLFIPSVVEVSEYGGNIRRPFLSQVFPSVPSNGSFAQPFPLGIFRTVASHEQIYISRFPVNQRNVSNRWTWQSFATRLPAPETITRRVEFTFASSSKITGYALASDRPCQPLISCIFLLSEIFVCRV